MEQPIPQVKDLVSINTSALANMLIELEPLIMLGLTAANKNDSLAHSTTGIHTANKTDSLVHSSIGDHEEHSNVHSTTVSSAIEVFSTRNDAEVNSSPEEISEQSIAIENLATIELDPLAESIISDHAMFEEHSIVHSTTGSSAIENSTATHGSANVSLSPEIHSSIQTEDLATVDVVPLAHSSFSSNNDEEEKYFIPLVEPGRYQYIEILDLLEDKEIVVLSDDITITIDSGGMPQPMKTTIDGLVKREADIISSNIPFNG